MLDRGKGDHRVVHGTARYLAFGENLRQPFVRIRAKCERRGKPRSHQLCSIVGFEAKWRGQPSHDRIGFDPRLATQ